MSRPSSRRSKTRRFRRRIVPSSAKNTFTRSSSPRSGPPLRRCHRRRPRSERSTCMVEMTEAAAILHRATPQSLVLIDEIGRGTSTFDGLALAWAIAHQLAERNRSLAMFATHYFELTALPAEIDGCANLHFDAVEHASGIVFLHAAEGGPANRSYGLQVAKLAGVPAEAIRRAKGYLARLDKFSAVGASQADLFAPPGVMPQADESTPESSPEAAAIAAKLADLDPDAMSPRDAHAALYELRKLLGR